MSVILFLFRPPFSLGSETDAAFLRLNSGDAVLLVIPFSGFWGRFCDLKGKTMVNKKKATDLNRKKPRSSINQSIERPNIYLLN